MAQSNTPNPPTYNLLELLIEDCLVRSLQVAKSKKRQTPNLHPLATLGLFAHTQDMSNVDLVRLIQGESAGTVYDRGEKAIARHLRSIGKLRTFKFNTLNRNAALLLTEPSFRQSKIVRGWVYCLILESARLTIAEALKTSHQGDLENLKLQPLVVVDPMIATCIKWIQEKIDELFERAEYPVRVNVPAAEQMRFLPYAAAMLLISMERPGSPEESLQYLKTVIDPEIDAYIFGDDEEAVEAYLSSP